MARCSESAGRTQAGPRAQVRGRVLASARRPALSHEFDSLAPWLPPHTSSTQTMLEAAKAAVMSVLCPSTRRALGYAPQSFQSPDESDHDRSFVHRRLHLPLNAAAKSLLLFRPITLLLALVIALVGGLASAFFSLTRISPPALECPTDGPRTDRKSVV